MLNLLHYCCQKPSREIINMLNITQFGSYFIQLSFPYLFNARRQIKINHHLLKVSLFAILMVFFHNYRCRITYKILLYIIMPSSERKLCDLCPLIYNQEQISWLCILGFTKETQEQVITGYSVKFLILSQFIPNKQAKMELKHITSLLLLISLAFGMICPKGEVLKKSGCISCRNIPNTEIGLVELNYYQTECPCKLGFIWSNSKVECVPFLLPNFNKFSLEFQLKNNNNIADQNENSRFLQSSTCNIAGGYMLYQQLAYSNNNPVVCYNCRLLPYGLTASSGSTCTCQSGFEYLTDWTSCYCYLGYYIDPKSGICASCVAMGSLISQCSHCEAPYFISSLTGCIFSPSLPNGGKNGGCAASYTFDWYKSACLCTFGSYFINANGSCVPCASTDSDCKNCKNSYYSDATQCYQGSLIANYDYITTFACKTGYTPKFNPYNGGILSCACSFTAKYYQNGANCISCSTSLPSGISLTSCQSCSTSAKFYKGSVECIYCPGVQLSLGTASINGCDCPINYFWNADTDLCECDFALGYIGGAIASCINCSNIPNTNQIHLPNACSCLPGYKWNSLAKKCDCDSTSGSIFTLGGACVNCANMPGATGSIAAGNTSCVCIYGYYWNPALKKCVCDYTQNYVIGSNDFCTDCKSAPLSNGLANAFGCICNSGFVWSTSAGKCLCPSGSVVIGLSCVSCSSATLPSGTVATDCTACSNAKGFVSESLGCYLCSAQAGANAAVTNGVCTCAIANTVWRPNIGACACDWTQFYFTRFSTTLGYQCSRCSVATTDPSRCKCENTIYYLDNANKVCTNTGFDVSGTVSNTSVFACNATYRWSEATYPYKCVFGFPAFQGFYSSSANSFTACNATNSNSVCSVCDTASGYLLVSGSNICLLCSTVAGSTGVATASTCVCNSNLSWNGLTLTCDSITCSSGMIYNPNLKACVCDPVKSIIVGSTCTACASISQTTSYAVSTSACGCNYPLNWVGGACINGTATSCNPATQIALANGSCFNCPTSNGGTGAANGTACVCTSIYIWTSNVTGGVCICDLTKAYLSGSTCTACPTGTNGDGKGGCLCTGTNVWQSGACIGCNSVGNNVMLVNGSCFLCGTSGTYTAAKVVSANNNSCTCTSANLTWNSNGYCGCPSSLFIFNATATSCNCDFTKAYLSGSTCTACPTGTKGDGKGGCLCTGTNVWQSGSCVPCNTVSNYVVLSSGSCFLCGTSGTYTAAKVVSANNNSCTCTSANLTWNSNGYCGCPSSLFIFNATATSCNCDFTKAYLSGSTCTACPTGTKGPDGKGGCLCTGTNVWQSGACIGCNSVGNNVMLVNSSCFLCGTSGTYTLSKIVSATNSTCSCVSTAFVWNAKGYCECTSLYVLNATNSSCACDFTKAYLSGTNCTACPTTTKGPDGKGGCLCNGTAWNGASCVLCNTAPNYVVLSSGLCFLCGTNNTYTASKVVSANNNSCTCTSANLTWNSNGYCGCPSSLFIFNATATSCNCDFAKAYLSGTSCTACPSISRGPDGKGGCLCNGTNVWQGGSCISCNISTNVVILSNGSCFICGTTGTYTSSKANNICTCSSNFLTWNFNGYCDCGNSSALVIAGNTFSCFNCINATAFTIGKASSTSCTCTSSNLQWNAITRVCDCGNLTNAIIIGNGTSLKCFSCMPSTTVIGASADMTVCVCVGKLVWSKITSTCGCANSSLSIVGVGINTQCISCSSVPYGRTNLTSSTGCNCLGAGLIFNTTLISCTCLVNSIITSSFACLSCPSGSSPVTPYECLCSIGSIWNSAAGVCTQCGSSSIPNSLPNRGTNFACVCNAGYIWDVMTLSCILSTSCTTVSASCMKCPSGSAKTLNAASSKNLIGGATVQALLNGTFTNYNQIKGFQCTCQAGFSWDSFRLRCFTTGLQ